MASFTDILSTIQNGVTSFNNFAIQMKGSFNNIAGQFAGINAAWVDYTPNVTSDGGAPTTYTSTGRYKQIGKTIIFETTVTITVVGPANGSLIFSLPITSAVNYYVGSSISVSSGKSGYAFLPGLSSQVTVQARDATFTSYIGAGAIIALTITYEAA